jgi:tetratricopeptide (TPR) repeat protein
MQNESPFEVLARVAPLLERRRTAQARALLAPALQAHPAHPGLLLQAVWVDYLENDYDAALKGLRALLAQTPETAEARLLLFLILMGKERYVEAEPVIIGLLRDFPESADYCGDYALLMLKTLNLEKAKRLAEQGLAYDATDTNSLMVLTICDFIERKSVAPSQALQQLIIKQPESLHTLLLVIVALEQRGDVAGARRVAGELVAAHPHNQDLVRLAHALTVNSHWSMLPLWPLRKWGGKASVAIWIGSIVAVKVLQNINPGAATIFVVVALGYCVYSWVWPSLLTKMMAPRDL